MIRFFSKDSKKEPSSFRQGLQRTRYRISQQMRALSQGSTLTPQHWEQLMDLLLISDTGLETAEFLTEQTKKKCHEQNIHDPQALINILHEQCLATLRPYQQADDVPHNPAIPYTVLLVGINGAGKTTTAAKLAYHYQQKGHQPMLAAGDTFRAAAIEQLTVWAERYHIPIVAQPRGADSAAVVFDALQSAQAKGRSPVIADTAGRLHTANNLMDELKKIKRVMQKIDVQLPHKTYLVLDANLGQSSLEQAKQFDAAVGMDGLIMSKLDGTAKGGALLALAHQLQKPIAWVGMGEGAADLQPFDALAFVDSLLHEGP